MPSPGFRASITKMETAMMEPNIPREVIDNTDRFYTTVKSVSEFDKAEVRPVI